MNPRLHRLHLYRENLGSHLYRVISGCSQTHWSWQQHVPVHHFPLHHAPVNHVLVHPFQSSRSFSSSSSSRGDKSLLSLLNLDDLRFPHAWYPAARSIQRRVFLHVGPTNSGKTHAALQSFRSAESGVYCGPLRLLAWEVAERANGEGVPCNLLTGQERREVEGARHVAMTVEMADITRPVDCAVVDEIQMCGSPDRGFAFTRALLGLPARELHVCGDPAATALVQRVLSATGDRVEVIEYTRLSPLRVLSKALGGFGAVRPGDCVVAFSRREIHRIKQEIEQLGRHRCCTVYGSLPPETRSKQAVRFNDPESGYDVLVASDAVGMGLNLNIRRVVFSALEKFDGEVQRPLTASEVKQIAGRAGRFKSMYPEGQVTCFEAGDLEQLRTCVEAPPVMLEAAGLFPSFEQLSLFSSLHPSSSFMEVLEEFLASARLSADFFMTDCSDMMDVAAALEDVDLNLRERFTFCVSPVDVEDAQVMSALVQFATAYSRRGEVPFLPHLTPASIRIPRTVQQLAALESLYKVLDLYLWLALRLPDAFADRETVEQQKALCSVLIDEGLKVLGEKYAPGGRAGGSPERAQWRETRRKQRRALRKARRSVDFLESTLQVDDVADDVAADVALHELGTWRPGEGQPVIRRRR